jgi:YVTN family beta-propeller protein
MHVLACSARRLAGGLTSGRRQSHLPALRHLIPLAGTAGLMILVSACASGPGHQASATRARPRHTTVVAAARPPTPAARRPATTAPSGTGSTGSTSSGAAATHPQSEQLATTTLGSFQVVLTKVRDTEPGDTSQAEVLARGYVNGNPLATRQIGDGYGWNWFASGVCSLTITTGTGPPGKAVKVGGNGNIAIMPNGKTAYVTNGAQAVIPVDDTVTNTALKAIRVGEDPQAIAITPDGKTAYVVNTGLDTDSGHTVTAIRTATNTVLRTINVGSFPVAIAITP